MTENRFLKLVLFEGTIATVLGLGMLILPKVSLISFGFMICLSFIIYGIFKTISALLSKNFSRHFFLDMLVGFIICLTGILLCIAPSFDLSWIIGLCGVYFVLKSISSSAFSVQTRKTLSLWWTYFFVSVLELILGLIIIVMIPTAALWFAGIMTGFDYILSGVFLINMFISTKYRQGG